MLSRMGELSCAVAFCSLIVLGASCGSIGSITDPAGFSVSVSADPNFAFPPLEGVDVTVRAANASGDVRYRISCGAENAFDRDITTAENPYTVRDLCSYTQPRIYIVHVVAEYAGETVTASTKVVVKQIPPVGYRALEDRPDEVQGPQVHLVVMIAKDHGDGLLDLSGIPATSFSIAQKWFSSQTSGRSFPQDTYKGELDVTFVRAKKTAAEIAASANYGADVIAEELATAGLADKDKKNIVYYSGFNSQICDAISIGGKVDAVVLFIGNVYREGPCYFMPFAHDLDSPPLHWEYAAVRGILRTLGYVDPRAPHNDPNAPGYVNDSADDVMRTGVLERKPTTILDFDKNDYYDPTGKLGIKNLYSDPFLVKR